MKLHGKVVVITGASRGIGKEIAKKFASEGAKVVAASRTYEHIAKVADEISKSNGECLPVAVDISNEADVERMISAASAKFKRIDILVNNAGVGIFKPVVETTTDEFDLQFGVNMRGTYLATRAVLPLMISQEDGVIINIASLAGKNAVENGAVYAATKWAMIGFARSLMLEVRKYNVRIVTISPGSVDTSFGRGVYRPNSEKILKPEDVAEAALLAAIMPPRAMMSEVDLRPTNPK
ncbi:MAG: SDR family oxidoreductase [Candidatus Kryptoniota bacterium]